MVYSCLTRTPSSAGTCIPPRNGCSGKCRDETTGQVLKDSLVKEAHEKEFQFFDSKTVWRRVSEAMARFEAGLETIRARWVDVNECDDFLANLRLRLVACLLKATDESWKSYFAWALLVEALRTILSLAMTTTGGHCPDCDSVSEARMLDNMIDVAPAYFNAVIPDGEHHVCPVAEAHAWDQESFGRMAGVLQHPPPEPGLYPGRRPPEHFPQCREDDCDLGARRRLHAVRAQASAVLDGGVYRRALRDQGGSTHGHGPQDAKDGPQF